MKRFSKVLTYCIAGGLVLISAYLLFICQVPPANANFAEITFIPFCVTVNLSATDLLTVQAIPNWSNPNVASTVFYWLKETGTGSEVIPRTSICRPDEFYMSLTPAQTPTGEYEHNAEYSPFKFRGGPFWVTRGSDPQF